MANQVAITASSLAELSVFESDSEDDMTHDFHDGVPYWYNVIERLSWVGYHRARIFELAEFNKIVGGLRWALFHLGNSQMAGVVFQEFPKRDDTNIKIFIEEAVKVTLAIRALECPYKIKSRDIVLNRCNKTLNPVTWILKKIHDQDRDEAQYSNFAQHFTAEHEDAEAAAKDFALRLQQPSKNREYDAPHWKAFDNGILFDPNITPKVILAEYMLYSNYNKRHFPPKLVLTKEDTPEEIEEKMKLYDEQKKEAVAKLEVLSDRFFTARDQVIEKRVIDKSISTTTQLKMALKLNYYKKRLEEDAARWYAVAMENKKLEVHVKYSLKNTIEFEHDSNAILREHLVKLQANVARVYTTILKEFIVVKDKESEMRLNTKDGKIQRYSVHNRELLDRQEEKRKAIEAVLNGVFALKRRLEIVAIRTAGAKDRWVALKKKQINYYANLRDDYKTVDEAMIEQMNIIIARLEQANLEVTNTRIHVGDAGEDHRQVFTAYAADCRIAMLDLSMKARILVAKHKESIKRRNKLLHLFRKLQEDAIFAAQEFDKMFDVTRAIQEVSYELGHLETKAKELRSKKK